MIKTLNENRKLQQKVQILEKKVEGQKKFNEAQMVQNKKLKTTAQQAVKDKAWYQNEYIVEKHARQSLETALEFTVLYLKGYINLVIKIEKESDEKKPQKITTEYVLKKIARMQKQKGIEKYGDNDINSRRSKAQILWDVLQEQQDTINYLIAYDKKHKQIELVKEQMEQIAQEYCDLVNKENDGK